MITTTPELLQPVSWLLRARRGTTKYVGYWSFISQAKPLYYNNYP